MLHTILFEQSSEIFNLKALGLNSKKLTVICPGPDYADDFRAKLPDPHQANIITISKFIKDELRAVCKEIEVVSKSKLLVDLSIIYKKYFTHLDDEIFFSSFNLFTELRSFTLKIQDMIEILDDFDSEVVEVLTKFWLYLEVAEVVDEQKAYALLSDFYLDRKDDKLDQAYMFYGFAHMNSQQIDLIRNLSNSSNIDVYIPFPREVYNDSRPGDWISWIDVEDLKRPILKRDKECQIVRFTKGRLPKALSLFSKESKSNKMSDIDFLLVEKNPSMMDMNTIPFEDTYFKSPTNFFHSLLRELFVEIRNLYMGDAAIETSSLIQYIDNELKKIFENIGNKRNFRKLKLLTMVKSRFLNLLELSDENITLSRFNIKVVETVVELDLPRVYNVPLLNKSSYSLIRGIESIQGVDLNKTNWVCISSAYGGLKGGESQYNEKTASHLSALGPLRRPEFDYKIIKFYLREIMEHESTIVFLEEGLEEEKQKVEELFHGFNLSELPQLKNEDQENRNKFKFLKERCNLSEKHNTSIMSAAKLQTYIDCPLKYYYTYIDKLNLKIVSSSEIRADQLGVLEHKLIEDYLLKFNDYNEDNLLQLVRSVLDDFLEQHSITLNEFQYGKVFLEIHKYSGNGIRFLLDLKAYDPSSKLIFEYDLSQLDPTISGRVDCIIVMKDGIGVIDFKRSGFSIPSIKELTDMQKIQIWFYLAHLEGRFSFPLFFGYLNLSDPGESKIYSEEFSMPQSYIKLSKMSAGIQPVYNDYKTFYEKIILDLKENQEFLPVPRSASVCKFCNVAMICPRGKEL